MNTSESLEGMYREQSWSVSLPRGWNAYRSRECATFQKDPPAGALQVSAATKEGKNVTDNDLREFARERLPSTSRLAPAVCGEFVGFTATHGTDGQSWQEWWLRSGQLMVYVTYNEIANDENTDLAAVARILDSLVHHRGA